MNGCWAIVVAAGRGTRTGLAVNKAFYRVRGRTVLEHCLSRLERANVFDGAILVLRAEDMDEFSALRPMPFVRRVVQGGATRQDSVWNGLEALPADARIVAIHDAARMFVPLSVVRATVESARRFGSGVAATSIHDTVKRVNGAGDAVETLDRGELRAVQTPQAFATDSIRLAHTRAREDAFDATDDAALYERYIAPTHLCVLPEGALNQKLTTREDIMALSSLPIGHARIGFGFDAHRLVPDRPLVLLGVSIPYDLGLLGHSDADVAAHALMDALLGAAALGDIGALFPDHDPAYAGICSMLLVERVRALLTEKGFAIGNVDLTIIAQKPKIAPYRDEMRSRLAEALQIPVARIGLKGTTTEKMGYEGRGEGISAQCAALLYESDMHSDC